MHLYQAVEFLRVALNEGLENLPVTGALRFRPLLPRYLYVARRVTKGSVTVEKVLASTWLPLLSMRYL